MKTKLCTYWELRELSGVAGAAKRNCPSNEFLDRLDQSKRYALAPLPGWANGFDSDWTRCQVIHPLEAFVMLDVRSERLEELQELTLPFGSRDIAVIGGDS
jgi:hypothetical protein